MSFSISGIRILSFVSIIRYMTYCVKFFQKMVSRIKKKTLIFSA